MLERWTVLAPLIKGLQADDAFWAAVDRVSRDPSEAAVVADRYTRGHSAHAAFQDLLGGLAEVVNADGGSAKECQTARQYLVASLFVVAAWPSKTLLPGDPARRIQERAQRGFRRGAEIVVERGAGRCIHPGCREPLTELKERSPPAGDGRTWPQWRSHCATHASGDAEHPSHTLEAARARADREAVKVVLDEVAAEGTESAASRRRAKRSPRVTPRQADPVPTTDSPLPLCPECGGRYEHHVGCLRHGPEYAEAVVRVRRWAPGRSNTKPPVA